MTVPPTVDVIIPHYDDPSALHRMISAVARQTHPRELLHVIVADDGSPRAPEVRAPEGLRVSVVKQEDLGFRAAAARNLGAAAGDGEVLCFLDCDTVPEPGYVAAAVAGMDARTVTVGRRRHAAFPAAGGRSSGGDPLAGIEPLGDPEWLDDAYRATRALADADDASFRFVISAVLTVGRELFERIGGFDATIVGYGGEDWEIAWRLWRAGARFRRVADAVAWHDGPDWGGRSDDEASAAAQKNRETLALAQRISHPIARPDGVAFPIPDVQVHLHRAGSWEPGAVAATIATCLAAGDCRVVVPDGSGDTGNGIPGGIANPFPADPRVGPAVGGARIEVELLRPIGAVPGGWAEVAERLAPASHGTIIGADQEPIARFSTARQRALLEWSRRGLAPRPKARAVPVQWPVLRGPIRLEGRFAGWG